MRTERKQDNDVWFRMKSHSDYEKIFQALQGCMDRIAPWSGVIYRSTSPRYYSRNQILSGEGGSRRGGRWNPVGIKAVYGSLTPETAMAETLQLYRYRKIPIVEAMPKVFVAIEVSISRTLDLRNTDTLRILNVSLEEILDEDWRMKEERGEESLSQAIGRAAYSAGAEGILAPAAADRMGTNVVVYPEGLAAGSMMEVVRL